MSTATRRSGLVTAMLVVAAMAAAACSSGAPQTTLAATPPTLAATTTSNAASSSTTAPTSPIAAAPSTSRPSSAAAACRAENLSVARGRNDAAMGHYGLWFDFTNQGDTCTLAGYPQILGLNAAGAWEPAPARQTIDSYIPAAPSIGPLARGESATVLLQGSNSAFYPNTECPTGPKSPPSYQKVAFVLPGDATRLEVDTNVSGMCELAISTFGSPRR